MSFHFYSFNFISLAFLALLALAFHCVLYHYLVVFYSIGILVYFAAVAFFRKWHSNSFYCIGVAIDFMAFALHCMAIAFPLTCGVAILNHFKAVTFHCMTF
jgi:hypothetical protein